MVHSSLNLRGDRRFMNDASFRSAPSTPYPYNDSMSDPRAPRYAPPYVYDNIARTGYSDKPYDTFGLLQQSRSPYERGLYGYADMDENIRRTNREAALANGAIPYPSRNVQLHPMATPDGRYPADFSVPRRLEDLLEMSDHELDGILMVYEIGEHRHRHYRGSLRNSFDDDDLFRGSKSEKRRNMTTLCEFLGAHRLVQHLMTIR